MRPSCLLSSPSQFLAVAAAPASATFKPGNTKEVFKEIERNLP